MCIGSSYVALFFILELKLCAKNVAASEHTAIAGHAERLADAGGAPTDAAACFAPGAAPAEDAVFMRRGRAPDRFAATPRFTMSLVS